MNRIDNLTVALSQSAFLLDKPWANTQKAKSICEDAAEQGAKVIVPNNRSAKTFS